MEGEEDLSEKRKFRREIEVKKNTVTKVSDDITRICGKVDGIERMLKIIENVRCVEIIGEEFKDKFKKQIKKVMLG